MAAFVQCTWTFAESEKNLRPHTTPTVTKATEKKRFNVLADVVVVSAAQRKQIGAKATPPLTDKDNGFAWPDTPIGVMRNGNNYQFFASDGAKHNASRKYGSATVTFANLNNPLGVRGPLNNIIHPNPSINSLYRAYTYIGGGPVYRVPQGLPGVGSLLMVYHAERPTTGQVGFYSLLGLAKSTDGGRNWTDLGEIIEANQRFQRNLDGYEIGDPRLVTDLSGKYFLIHFPDWIANGTPHRKQSTTNLSVARAPVLDLLRAAFGKPQERLPPFVKYYQGEWKRSGINGLSSDVLDKSTHFAGSPQVAYSAYLREYIAIFDDNTHITYARSADGLSWSPALLLKTGTNVLYATPIGAGGDPTELGPNFFVYYVVNPKGWPSATVHRLTVSTDGSAAPTPPPPPPAKQSEEKPHKNPGTIKRIERKVLSDLKQLGKELP